MFYCFKAKAEYHRFCEKSLFSKFRHPTGQSGQILSNSQGVLEMCQKSKTMNRLWESKQKSLRFGILRIWRKPANHVDDCYFCIVNVAGFSSKNKFKINYPNIP